MTQRTGIPPEFLLTDVRRAFAEGLGLVDPQREFDRFRSYHRETERQMSDWDAAWRYWARNAREFQR